MKSEKSVFSPDLYIGSLAEIDFGEYYKQGYRLVLLDIDNTLSQHGQNVCGDYAKSQVSRILLEGMECLIVSNARTARAKTYADSLGIPFVPRAGKPSKKGVREALRMFPQYQKKQLMIVGDQLLTDILAGNRSGIHTVLVDPISSEEPGQVRIKRPVERGIKRLFRIKRKEI